MTPAELPLCTLSATASGLERGAIVTAAGTVLPPSMLAAKVLESPPPDDATAIVQQQSSSRVTPTEDKGDPLDAGIPPNDKSKNEPRRPPTGEFQIRTGTGRGPGSRNEPTPVDLKAWGPLAAAVANPAVMDDWGESPSDRDVRAAAETMGLGIVQPTSSHSRRKSWKVLTALVVIITVVAAVAFIVLRHRAL